MKTLLSPQPHKFYPEILTAEAIQLLPQLAKIEFLKDFYLAGGTALALSLGHRVSVDFDFFSPKDFPAESYRLFQQLAPEDFQLLVRNKGAVEFSLKRVKIMLWENYLPVQMPLRRFMGIDVLDPVDVGFLKLVALEGRTTWKDIIDLYFLHQEIIPLEQLLREYKLRMPKEYLQLYVNIKTLIDPVELSKSPKPQLLRSVDYQVAYNLVSKELVKAAMRLQNHLL